MTFYIFMIPALVLMAAMIIRLRELTKHDKVLYEFCQLRRDLMALMRKHNYDLDKEDYIALRDIENAASSAIHDYNICKSYLFNFRKFSGVLRRLNPLETEDHKGRHLQSEILALKRKFGYALVFAFFTFTPFLKYEIVFRTFKKAIMALGKVSGNYFRSKLRRTLDLLSWMQTAKSVYW